MVRDFSKDSLRLVQVDDEIEFQNLGFDLVNNLSDSFVKIAMSLVPLSIQTMLVKLGDIITLLHELHLKILKVLTVLSSLLYLLIEFWVALVWKCKLLIALEIGNRISVLISQFAKEYL